MKRRTYAAAFAVSFLVLVAATGAMPASAQTKSSQTFLAPKLIVPIPGLDFKKYPIVVQGEKVSIPFLAAYISAFYQYLVGISVVAAAVMIVYGGVHYLVGSSVASVGRAKEIIRDALIGLVLIMATYTILATVNPATVTTLKPLELDLIKRQEYLSHVADLDGVPIEKMTPWDNPSKAGTEGTLPSAPPSEAPSGPEAPSGGGPVCGGGFYKLPEARCSGFDQCKSLFCDRKDYSFEGGPDTKTLVGFDGIFPNTVGEQIQQKGLTFVLPKACYKKGGCDSTSYLAIQLLGPKAALATKWRMDGTMRFRPEVRDALIKAGEAAKKRGYFLGIGDGTRTMETQASHWCQRIKETGSAKGMATPGLSPHQLAVAVDIALLKLENNKVAQLTAMGGICTQVEVQKQLGPENLKILEEIMWEAGWKHMCQEVWHFDYKGVYQVDCSSCDFPGKMQERTNKDKTCKK